MCTLGCCTENSRLKKQVLFGASSNKTWEISTSATCHTVQTIKHPAACSCLRKHYKVHSVSRNRKHSCQRTSDTRCTNVQHSAALQFNVGYFCIDQHMNHLKNTTIFFFICILNLVHLRWKLVCPQEELSHSHNNDCSYWVCSDFLYLKIHLSVNNLKSFKGQILNPLVC